MTDARGTDGERVATDMHSDGDGIAGAGTAEDHPPARRRPGSTPLVMTLVAAVAVLAAIVGVALTRSAQPDPSSTAGADLPPLLRDAADVGPMPLPDATVPALAGHGPEGGRDLSDLRGAPVVINFWASWCDPCVEEMPRLQQVGRDLGVTVVGIAYLDQEKSAIATAERLGITYELLRDDDGVLASDVGLIGMPTTLFVDADGTIVRRLTGELTEEQMRAAIEAELL